MRKRVFALVCVIAMVFVAFQSIEAQASTPNTGAGEWNHALASHGAVATGSTQKSGYEVTKANDGSTATYWQASKTTGSLSVKFGAPKPINEVHIHFSSMIYKFNVYIDTNNDGTYETQVLAVTNNQNRDFVSALPGSFTRGIKFDMPTSQGVTSGKTTTYTYPNVAEIEAYVRYDANGDGVPDDSDGDGLTDVYEATTVYRQDMTEAGVPVGIVDDAKSVAIFNIDLPPWYGVGTKVFLDLQMNHSSPGDLVVAVGYDTGSSWQDRLAWVPGGFTNSSIWATAAFPYTYYTTEQVWVNGRCWWDYDDYGQRIRVCDPGHYEDVQVAHTAYNLYPAVAVSAGVGQQQSITTGAAFTAAASSRSSNVWHVTIDMIDPTLDATETAAGFRAPSFTAADFHSRSHWRILVRDYNPNGVGGTVTLAAIRSEERSNQAVADTDLDGLMDGAERTSTIPTLPIAADTDNDGLSDSFESMAQPLSLTVNGITTTVSIKTDPTNRDTDEDGLSDREERSATFGFTTDPSKSDTDTDGLTDREELEGLNGEVMNPVVTDMDGDGIFDGLDLAPKRVWDFPWSSSFGAGEVRFTQRLHVSGLTGMYAWMYQWIAGTCFYLGDDVASATRSSDYSTQNALTQMNKVLADGGETNYLAISSVYVSTQGQGYAEYAYGPCDWYAPKRYVIGYETQDRLYDFDLKNTLATTVSDNSGVPFSHAVLDIAMNASKAQSIILQLKVRADADRGSVPASGTTVLPAIQYSLTRGRDFANVAPFYRNLAVGMPIDDHVYQFDLRVPASAMAPGNLFILHGPTATLTVSPMWITSSSTSSSKAALDPSAWTVGAAIVKVQEKAERLVSRLSVDLKAMEAALPSTISSYGTGYYWFGSFYVYVYRLGTSFDANSVNTAQGVYFIGPSEGEVADYIEDLAWNPNWYVGARDGFSNGVRLMKFFDYTTSFIEEFGTAIRQSAPPPLYSALKKEGFNQYSISSEKLPGADGGGPYYVNGVTVQKIGISMVPNNDIPSISQPERVIQEERFKSEIITDPDQSTVLQEPRMPYLREGIRGAQIGAALAVYGSQAAIAWRDGNYVKVTAYASAGGVSVFGIVYQNKVVVDNLFSGAVKGGVKLKVGTVAGIAAGAILAGYDLYMASQTSDPIRKQGFYEEAAAEMADAIISVCPYGGVVMLSWIGGVYLAVAVSNLIGIPTNELALHIVSSPGSTIVFLFQYWNPTTIPSDIAGDAFQKVVSSLVEQAEFNNARTTPPVPTIVLIPPT